MYHPIATTSTLEIFFTARTYTIEATIAIKITAMTGMTLSAVFVTKKPLLLKDKGSMPDNFNVQ